MGLFKFAGWVVLMAGLSSPAFAAGGFFSCAIRVTPFQMTRFSGHKMPAVGEVSEDIVNYAVLENGERVEKTAPVKNKVLMVQTLESFKIGKCQEPGDSQWDTFEIAVKFLVSAEEKVFIDGADRAGKSTTTWQICRYQELVPCRSHF